MTISTAVCVECGSTRLDFVKIMHPKKDKNGNMKIDNFQCLDCGSTKIRRVTDRKKGDQS